MFDLLFNQSREGPVLMGTGDVKSSVASKGFEEMQGRSEHSCKHKLAREYSNAQDHFGQLFIPT